MLRTSYLLLFNYTFDSGPNVRYLMINFTEDTRKKGMRTFTKVPNSLGTRTKV